MHGPQPGQQPPPLTLEDWKRIEKSMKKPEFLGLLSEYMVQISDPKNKQQYDDYLRQMQTDGELPKYMKLIQPQPRFCIKTGLVAQRNKSQEMKFFINMCSAEQIEKPSFEAKMTETGEVGQSWRIPNSMGKIRYDQDVNGAVCNTVDAVFHPETFNFARNKRFEAMIINIAIETAQKQLGERKQTLSKDYIVMEKLKCKGGQPAILPIRQIEGKTYSKGEGGEQERDRDGVETKLQKEIMDRKKQHHQQKQKEQIKKKEQVTEQELAQSPLAIQGESKGPQRPQYSTIYTYPVEYMDFIEGGVNKTNKHPTSINIEFKIPLISEFKEIKSLDINEQKVLLDAGSKYFIDLSFSELKTKYRLVHSESKAKFDKKKKSLRITIPIDPASIKQQETKIQSASLPEQVHEQPQQQLEEQKQVIEDKTWQDKKKLLQITQPKVALQVISKSQIQQKQAKKFVQQIDEDDINATEANKAKQQKVKQIVVAETKVISPSQTQLSFKFQEIREKSFIIINLPKYKKQQIELIVTGDQILLLWNSRNGIKYLNAKVSKEVSQKDVQVVYVVDFVVINIAKHSDNDKVSIDSVEVNYKDFIQNFNKQKSILDQQEQQQQKRKQEQQDAQAKSKDNQSSIQKQSVEQQVKETKIDQSAALEPSRENTFKKALNPQFIHFKISIIDQLD